MPKLSLAAAKTLCTTSEWQLVRASQGSTLSQLSGDELKKNLSLARRLRNKWRDLATEQRRETQRQQGSRLTKTETRTRQKAELFEEVVGRFEEQLRKVESSAASPSPALKTPRRVSKQKRTAEHRQTRAETRKNLEEKRLLLEAQRAADAAKTPAAVPPAKAKAATRKRAVKPSAAAPKAKKAARKKPPAVKPTKAKFPNPASGETTPGNFSRSLTAKTAAKRARIKTSGLTTRTRGHVTARGRRKQARRDSMN